MTLSPSAAPVLWWHQGFAALRAISDQCYLERCSSSSSSDGVLVEAASRAIRMWPVDEPKYVFAYRVRITNQRSDIIQVLGREWKFSSAGRDEVAIALARNAVVGESTKPITPQINKGSACHTWLCMPKWHMGRCVRCIWACTVMHSAKAVLFICVLTCAELLALVQLCIIDQAQSQATSCRHGCLLLLIIRSFVLASQASN